MTNNNLDLIILKAKALQVSLRVHPGIIDFFKASHKNYTSEMSKVILDYAATKMTQEDIEKYILPYEDNKNRFGG